MLFSSIKEKNGLISKGMSNIYHWKKTDVFKTSLIFVFLGKKLWRIALALKSKKVQGIFGQTFILALLFSAVFYKTVSQTSLNLFCLGDKKADLYQKSLGNEVDFRDISNFAPNILAKY